jgi:very-short-patch-repair endonuclease
MSDLEELLGEHIKLSGLPSPAREYRFHPRRRWRFDFAWPRHKIAVEVDGGIYNRGRHVRGSGFERDAEKRNAAVMAGWRVLHFTPRHVRIRIGRSGDPEPDEENQLRAGSAACGAAPRHCSALRES